MRIAYATRFDAADVKNWSGISHHMIDALRRAGAEIELIGPLVTHGERLARARRRAARMRGRVVDITREPAVVAGWGRQVDRLLKGGRSDLVLTPDVPALAGSKDGRPKAVWSGSSLSVLTDYYADYTRLTTRSLRQGLEQERALLARCVQVIYASDWVSSSARAAYDLDPAKVAVVPFGANIAGIRDEAELARSLRHRGQAPWRFLFLGIDWARKRGALAVDVVRELKDRGHRVHLSIVGCDPPAEVASLDWVTASGFISKDTPSGLARIVDELDRAHFLLHPTRADTFGIALCEAAARGVPSIASKTGGVPTIILDGETGALLPTDARALDYANRVEAVVTSPGAYDRMAQAAHTRWRTLLNWDTAGAEVIRLLEVALSQVSVVR